MAEWILRREVGGVVSMIHVFAVDPTIFLVDPALTSLVRAGLQLHRGRAIAKFPINWSAEVSKQIASLAPMQRKRLMTWLEEVKPFSDCKRHHDSECNWLANAKSHQGNAGTSYRAILSTESDAETRVLNIRGLEDSDEHWRVDSQAVIPRKNREIAEACKFFMLHANKIILVEPYFDPGDEHKRRTLTAILQTLPKRAGGKPEIELHTYKNPKFNLKFSEDFESEVPGCIPKGFTVNGFLWEKIEGGERFHRRYVLTDIGGMYFEGGLDSGQAGETTDVALLEPTLNRERKKDYHPMSTKFNLVRQFSVKGASQ
jgi:hypothetical protein